jgi:TonB family protein
MLGLPRLLCALGVALAPLAAQAQGGAPGTLTGMVRDSTGAGIAGAELTVAGAGTTFTDETGIFRITAVPSGTVSVRARRLGFRPATLEVVLEPGATDTLSITIARLAQHLSAVVVRGARRRPSGDFGGFYDRRDRGFGHFIAREQIERQHPTQVTDVIRMVPGVRLVPTRLISDAVRLRGAGMNCPPQFWIDGTRLGEEFNMDFLEPSAVEGIEIYSAATVPPQFMAGPDRRTCGTIVVWTRRGERRQRAKRVTTAELAAMVASTTVYTADQVDSAVRADASEPVRPIYPDSLFRARVAGETVVEFVVDTTGAVETETFGVVSSTHPLFTESVRRALRDAEFFPAILRGRKVRQVVQQPFRFVLSDSAATKR